MGLLKTRWEARYRGHTIAVTRNELTRGFSIWWDDVEIARRTWSWVGLGTLHGTAEVVASDAYRDVPARTFEIVATIT